VQGEPPLPQTESVSSPRESARCILTAVGFWGWRESVERPTRRGGNPPQASLYPRGFVGP